MAVLDVTDLRVSFPAAESAFCAVDGVSFHIEAGETLGLIGETGSGKSVTAQALMGMVPHPGRVEGGQILLQVNGQPVDLVACPDRGPEIRRLRGGEIAMVFQDPVSSLTPVRTIASQLGETVMVHRSVTHQDAEDMAADLLARVGLPEPKRRLREYPHQLSGGMAQRVALALALAGNPRVLIADEPTTALDPAAQIEIVRLLRRLQQETNLGVLFITHDLRLAEHACDRVAVLYAGQIIEHAQASELLQQPLHPYTTALLRSAPRLGAGRQRLSTIPGRAVVPSTVIQGCRFVDRCPDVIEDVCRRVAPAPLEAQPAHEVSCHLYASQ